MNSRNIADANTGNASASEIQNRRVMSWSSRWSVSAAGFSGSSAMPQIGQKPGAFRLIRGCIGQV